MHINGEGRNLVANNLWPNPFAFTFNLMTYWLNVYHIPWVFVHIVFAVFTFPEMILLEKDPFTLNRMQLRYIQF